MHNDAAALLVGPPQTHPVQARPASPEAAPLLGSPVGFLLLDSSLRPIAFNAEAIKVLSHSDKLATGPPLDAVLAETIRASLLGQEPSREAPLVIELRSGRRRYLCRVFRVDADAKASPQPSVAVLLERPPFGSIPLWPAFRQFNLTRRERDTLGYLVQGLSNKEIADRMKISSNTVKAFLRLIMTKMAVCSRSAIVAKILMTQS